MTNVLVIGGAGYIGSHVVAALLDAGETVTVFDNLSTGTRENLFSEARFVHGDILDKQALSAALTGQEAVVHLAAKKAVGESMQRPDKYAENNITGTLNVLNAMAENDVKAFVFSSSAAVYGMPQESVLDETCPVDPINFYGFTKLEIERFLTWYDRLKDIRFVSLRYFNAVGYDEKGRIKGLEKNPQNLLPIIMETAVGIRPKMAVFGNDYDTPDGTCIRDYIHVTDLADAHVRALRYLKSGGKSQILNLGTGTGHSVMEMIQKTQSLINRPIAFDIAPRRPGDPGKLTAKADAARAVLGWIPKHSSLEEIILSTWRLYQK